MTHGIARLVAGIRQPSAVHRRRGPVDRSCQEIKLMKYRTPLSAALVIAAQPFFFAPTAEANDDFICYTPSGLVAAQEYWTPERQREAVPDDADDVPSKPDPARVLEAKRANVDEIPYKYGGKLFYTRGGKNLAASAQFVAYGDVLMAAAHSMVRGKDNAGNIAFFRAYADGGGEEFKVDRVAVLKGWPSISNNEPSLERSASDYAVLRTTSRYGHGQFLLGTDRTFTEATLMGYPSELEEGKYMYKQLTAKQAQVGDAYEAKPFELSQGVSGGAWFVGDATLVSVISSQLGKAVAGPVVTDKMAAMVDYVEEGCP
jgi:hypothetical protein